MNSPIQSRRSIRRYQDTPLPPALVEAVVQAGALAPSSKTGSPGILSPYRTRKI